MLLVGMTLGLRVSPEDEERGLDKSEHGVGGALTLTLTLALALALA
jgi:ammonia channel protein AmtB